jgi:hypothetical protein
MIAEIAGRQSPNRRGADPITIDEAIAYRHVPGRYRVIHDFAVCSATLP